MDPEQNVTDREHWKVCKRAEIAGTCWPIVCGVSLTLLVQVGVNEGLEEEGHEGDESPEEVS